MTTQLAQRYIGFRVAQDRDTDILQWWDAIPAGERSHILRSLIRAYLCGEIILTPQGEQPTVFSSSVQLAQLQADALWIKTALSDMPAYLEHMISGLQVIAAQPVPPIAPNQGNGSSPDLSEQAAAERAARIKSRSW